jgi:RNA polymerase sigma-70 factor (ECF subfamily)
MSQTSVSLLDRLREQPDDPSWKRLVDLYSPLIHSWLRRYAVQPSDADDLVQEVLGAVVRDLPRFRHDRRPGAFRCWLRTITVNRLRGFWRARQARPVATGDSDLVQQLEQLEDPTSSLSQRWDAEHDRHVLNRLLELLEPEFAPTSWQAFRRVTLEGKRASDVAAELGLSVNAVLLAKSRVLRRLRQEAQDLIEC